MPAARAALGKQEFMAGSGRTPAGDSPRECGDPRGASSRTSMRAQSRQRNGVVRGQDRLLDLPGEPARERGRAPEDLERLLRRVPQPLGLVRVEPLGAAGSALKSTSTTGRTRAPVPLPRIAQVNSRPGSQRSTRAGCRYCCHTRLMARPASARVRQSEAWVIPLLDPSWTGFTITGRRGTASRRRSPAVATTNSAVGMPR